VIRVEMRKPGIAPINRNLAKALIQLANRARASGRISRVEERFTIMPERRFPSRWVEKVIAIDGRKLDRPLALSSRPKAAAEFAPLLD
jgi:hypothetical protein